MLRLITVLCVALCVTADQLLKLAALKYLEPAGSIPLIPKVVRLTYVENTGAAFGSFHRHTGLLSAVTAVVLLVLLACLLSGRLKLGFAYICLSMVAAGGLGNLIDRLFRGYVIDYIEPLFVDFAVFNFADMLVSVGAVLLAVYLLADLVKKGEKHKKPADGDD